MPLSANAVFTFNSYEVTDGGIIMHFVCDNPGAGMQSDWYITITDADLSTVNSLATFRTMVLAKLQRKFRGSGIANKLDNLIGGTVTLP